MAYAPPAPGTILDGYRFLGGNPKDQSRWQPVGPDAIAEAKARGAAQGKIGAAGVDQKAFNDAATQLKDLRSTRASVGFLNSGMIGAMQTPRPDANGKTGIFNSGIAGSPGYNLDKDLGTIRARLMFSNLKGMQRSSPTGASGLGPLSNAEGEALRSTVASLDNGLPAGQLRQNLDRVREDTILNQPGLVVTNPYDLSGGQSRATIPRNAYYRDPQGNIRQNKNGDTGNPIVPGYGPKPAPSTRKAAPKGIDPNIWSHMTPQEQALWQ